MARFKPERVEVTLSAEIHLNAEVPQVYEAPGGLFPLRAKAFELEEYRLCAGWPVPKPRYDIFARTMVSASGEKVADRVTPSAVHTGALARWIPDPDYYDITALRWNPIQDSTTGMYWSSSSNYSPVLVNDYTYRLGDEVFSVQALNFDSDTRKHLWADFSATIGGASGYTVIMVMSPNSIFGNDPTVPYNGLWCPGRPSPGTATFTETAADHYAMVTLQGESLYYEDEYKERTRVLSVANNLNSNAPMYLAMVISRPEVTFYVGEGPASVRVKSVPTGTAQAVPLDGHITLGRTPRDVLHTADLTLFDLGIYGELLNPDRIATEFSLLSQAYGGVDQ